MSDRGDISRRGFFKKASAVSVGAFGLPYVIPSSVFSKGRILPSERITVGFIGTGKQSRSVLLRGFLGQSSCQTVAVCDVDSRKREHARQMVDKKYKGCSEIHDFRDLIARDDIDAVVVATPDHWHAIPSIRAMKAGKDVYCEKPLSLTIEEARAMADTTRRYGRVLQTGSMQRSDMKFRFACELVRNGYIGDIKNVVVNVGGPPSECNLPAEPVLNELDWDMWLGPAPWRPYNSDIAPPIERDVFPNFRSYRDYAGGGMTDWGAHHFDIAQWALGMDHTGPVEIIPPNDKDVSVLTYKYANGVVMTREGTANGVLFNGTKGKVEVNRGYLKTWPDKLARVQLSPSDEHLYASPDHYRDFLDCIRTRKKPICDVEIGCRSATVCHIGNIAYLLERPLKWDPVKERFVGDEDANRHLSRSMRGPWRL
ncbi:MAG: Gfo/Idh/MocA family oxidoreductase [Planctomycetes bacterium]|nr:Gfo/Idh/MocA family oxidoreductase [Planctomycetota bacterium]